MPRSAAIAKSFRQKACQSRSSSSLKGQASGNSRSRTMYGNGCRLQSVSASKRFLAIMSRKRSQYVRSRQVSRWSASASPLRYEFHGRLYLIARKGKRARSALLATSARSVPFSIDSTSASVP